MRPELPAKRLYPALYPLLIVIVLGSLVFGQTSASLSGTVHDPQGNAVVGAKILLNDPAKSLNLETTTNNEGIFTFTSIPPAVYTVAVESPGFKKVVRTGIVVNVADKQSTGVISLEVGQPDRGCGRSHGGCGAVADKD